MRLTALTPNDSLEHAHDADEGPAILAWIALGGAFLLAAAAAYHRIMFAKFGHA
jgi:hypothetical protein